MVHECALGVPPAESLCAMRTGVGVRGLFRGQQWVGRTRSLIYYHINNFVRRLLAMLMTVFLHSLSEPAFTSVFLMTAQSIVATPTGQNIALINQNIEAQFN